MAQKNAFGTGFALITLLGLAVLFYFYTTDYFSKAHNPNQNVMINQSSGELVLQVSQDGHYRVDGLINGYPVVFMLDTGASGVALNEALAKKIGLEKGMRGQSSTANGLTHNWITHIDLLDMGGIQVRDVRASILPNMDDEVLLGMNVLGQLNIQQSNGELRLSQ
ncbi:retroviral-like aspartic protease family protein [Suttonella sp. R2A3]|uniref:retropepsin-like aspartic protease family protein n=1 Tax=Suttonella sp. R2A3 TaxID=2908648 RepID=UPI001F25AA57|nr:retropepsin-like aspartic protease [Suttonella sp. R2A3]UJF24548.1 retroviral-like aspartic protease family protein [Suttonella sp. R2A3]